MEKEERKLTEKSSGVKKIIKSLSLCPLTFLKILLNSTENSKS